MTHRTLYQFPVMSMDCYNQIVVQGYADYVAMWLNNAPIKPTTTVDVHFDLADHTPVDRGPRLHMRITLDQRMLRYDYANMSIQYHVRALLKPVYTTSPCKVMWLGCSVEAELEQPVKCRSNWIKEGF